MTHPLRKPVFAIFAGPSGGHLFPALAFAEALKKKHPEARIFFITSRKGEALTRGFPSEIFEKILFVENFPSSPGISLRTLTFLLKLGRAFKESFSCLSRIHPDMSIGFGSYVSFPGLLLSSWKGIPTLIHEQNQVPGKANRGLAPHVDAVAVSFPGTFQGKTVKTLQWTGLPIRRRLIEAASARHSKSVLDRNSGARKFHLLISGGSQGAKFLNSLILQAFSHLSSEEKGEIAVTHITGKTDFEEVSRQYQEIGFEARVFPFFEKMETLYAESDLALCRAGANTLFELALFQLPAIVVPYPHADGHQIENAKHFAGKQAILCEPESTLTSDRLLQLIRSLKENEAARLKMAAAFKDTVVSDASDRLVEMTESLLKGLKP